MPVAFASMRYRQTQEQSAELVRLSLGEMTRHRAAYHPYSFTLWYEHFAGINAGLTDELHGLKEPLDEAGVRRLFSKYVTARSTDLAERLHQDMDALLASTSGEVSDAAREASRLSTLVTDGARSIQLASDIHVARATAGLVLRHVSMLAELNSRLLRSLDGATQRINQIRDRLTQAHDAALDDPLTGLRNRRGFDRDVRRLSIEPTGLKGTSLIALDIDHFKSINDTHGHVMGDKVIAAVALVLRQNIKGRDIAVRLGGEEFGVLLPSTPLPGAVVLADKVRESVAQLQITRSDGSTFPGCITVSAGVAEGSERDDIGMLLERADQALYHAKRSGRNRVAQLTPA